MPIYTVSCKRCGSEKDIYRSIAGMDDLPKCCGTQTHRIISGSRVMPDIKPYKSMVTGEMITSRSMHRDHLKRHNVQEIGNEVDAFMKVAAPKKPMDRELRRRQIAEVLNSKT